MENNLNITPDLFRKYYESNSLGKLKIIIPEVGDICSRIGKFEPLYLNVTFSNLIMLHSFAIVYLF